MASVFDVAKYILQKTKSISTFKLQKLVYYSQVWSLIRDDKPLFNNKIFAWANGPVCKELYDFHKGQFWMCFQVSAFREISLFRLSCRKCIFGCLAWPKSWNLWWLTNVKWRTKKWNLSMYMKINIAPNLMPLLNSLTLIT